MNAYDRSRLRACQDNGAMVASAQSLQAVTRIMPVTKECPLCGGTMQLSVKEAVVQVPGNPKPSASKTREWVCPDCDYFEEADE